MQTKLTGIIIPSGVISIGDYAFASCTELTSITIPGSVTSIGSCAFQACNNLVSLTFGTGSDIEEENEWSSDTFTISYQFYDHGWYHNEMPTGTNLWEAYNTGSKAGSYTQDIVLYLWSQDP
jgi:hypothetical protein